MAKLRSILTRKNAKRIIEHKEGKMKNVLKNYYKPTPAKFRKLGDTLLVVGTSITMGALMEFDKLEQVFTSKEIKVVMTIALSFGVIGKFLTNFFVETKSNKNA
jgi:hypothetical protein